MLITKKWTLLVAVVCVAGIGWMFLRPFLKKTNSTASLPPHAALINSIKTTAPINNDFAKRISASIQPQLRIYGIDISRYQGNLLLDIDNMDTLHFVICKATEGDSYVDPDFLNNWHFIRKKGLVRGAYHFYQNSDNPIAQADHFLKVAKEMDSLDMPPVIDVEEGGLLKRGDNSNLGTNLLQMLTCLRRKTGRIPIIYTDLSFANTYLASESFNVYPLWLAEYSGKKSPRLPLAWQRKQYTIWQRKDTYHIGSHQTDFDIFNGNGNTLLAFIRKG